MCGFVAEREGRGPMAGHVSRFPAAVSFVWKPRHELGMGCPGPARPCHGPTGLSVKAPGRFDSTTPRAPISGVFEPPFDRPDRPQHACFAPGRAACFGWPPPSTAACPLPHNSSEFQELLIEEDLAALTNFFVTSAPDLLRAGRVPLRSFWKIHFRCSTLSSVSHLDLGFGKTVRTAAHEPSRPHCSRCWLPTLVYAGSIERACPGPRFGVRSRGGCI